MTLRACHQCRGSGDSGAAEVPCLTCGGEREVCTRCGLPAVPRPLDSECCECPAALWCDDCGRVRAACRCDPTTLG